MTFALESGKGGVDGSLKDLDPLLMKAAHDLVAVGLLLSQEVQKDEAQQALEELRVMSGVDHGAMICLVLG
jgi:hypothetical protein